MRFFERRRVPGPVDAVTGFWTWWESAGRDAVESAGSDGQRLADLLTPKVHAVDPGLAWEVGPPRPDPVSGAAPEVDAASSGLTWSARGVNLPDAASTSHSRLLVVTAAGDPDLRAPARRWLKAAPPSPGWLFADSRPAVADPRRAEVEYGGRTFAVSQAVTSATVRGCSINVCVHHPAYQDVDEQTRNQVTFLLLDSVLGEEAVETWLGAVSSSELPPIDPVPITGLRAVVGEIRSGSVDSDGQPVWVMLSGQTPDGTPIIAAAAQPLRSVVAPELDTYVGVALPFSDTTAESLPGPATLVALRAAEDELAGLGERGRVVAHQTSSGVRVLHVYVDGTRDGEAFVRAVASRWPGRATVTSERDPGWATVHHLS